MRTPSRGLWSYRGHVRLIGVDWAASDEAKRGIALAELDAAGQITLVEVCTGTRDEPAATRLSSWLATPGEVIVGIDAPLGWPRDLAAQLFTHRAGESLGAATDAARFFDRAADRYVARVYRKKPLSVGADLIARTAFSALALVAELRQHHEIEFGWEPPTSGKRVFLEVYPAATLGVLLGEKLPPYKKPEDGQARARLTDLLATHITMTRKQRALTIASDHRLDAVACVLAAADFAAGRCPGPPAELEELARHEGWIWIREPRVAP
jgi:predicted RNase H-like nuclease